MNLIFDLDDTLYLEKTHVYQGFWAVAVYLFNHLRVKPIPIYLEMVRLLRSGSKRIFDDLKESKGFQFETPEMVRVYRNAPRRLVLLPDVGMGLRWLRQDGHSLTLLTNGDSETQWKKIRWLELEKFFDLILVPDDYGRDHWKPSAKLMETITKRFGPIEKNYLFIGNAPDDLAFAENAGIPFVFMKRQRQLKTIDQDACGCRAVSKIFELIPIIWSFEDGSM